jgi:hypothetical protein
MKRILLIAGCVMALAGSQVANAVSYPYSFFKITNNGNPDVGAQLSVDVTDAGGGQVSFKFSNNVGTASSITDIYFDDGTLLGIATTSQSAGVVFNNPATPGNLPGANDANPDFETTSGFSADSDPSVAPNGVNSHGEWVDITFDLINGKTFSDTLAALSDGSLRIGLHVQAIGGDNGGSDSYVNNVPDGGTTAALLGLAMLGMGYLRSRRV